MTDVQREKFSELLCHVLRNQVSAMSGFADLIGFAGDLTGEQAEYLGRVTGAGAKVNEAMPTLIDIAWLEAGLPIERTPQPLEAMLEMAQSRVLELPNFDALGVTLVEEDFARGLTVHANAALLWRALFEPLRNAVLYSGPGSSVTIVLKQADGQALITIADEGIGMAPMDRDSAFDRFFRSRDPRVRAVPGHGIGLTLAQQVIRAHAGTMTLSSEFGSGTLVTITLPLDLPAGS